MREELKQIIQGSGSIEERAKLLAAARTSGAASEKLDQYLLAEIARQRKGLDQVGAEQKKLAALLEQMTKPPLFPAEFEGPAAGAFMVRLPSGGRRVVQCLEEIRHEPLHPGDEVLLNPEQNCIVAVSGLRTKRGGEIGFFDRHLDESRIVVRHRDEELALEVAGPLRAVREELAAGDLVRIDRIQMLAFEKMARSSGDRFFERQAPKATFASIGGLDAQIEEMKRLISLRFFHADIALRYGIEASGAVLLEGPPGTGKTMLAGAMAHWVGELAGIDARFIVVKPGELRSMWYGETERNFRELFRSARLAGERNADLPVVMFFDELDSIGATRGRSAGQLDDRIIQAFTVELDGVTGRGNVLVIGATNRRQALDPALTRAGRFGDKTIRVPRPGLHAAREILGKHLRAEYPYTGEREEMIHATASRLYAPNGQPPLCKLILRDGTQREVKAPDLLSGASLAKIARCALESACDRHVLTGSMGLEMADLSYGIEQELESLSRLLTPLNARDYIEGLPDDMDVTRVERPKAQSIRAAQRYRMIA